MRREAILLIVSVRLLLLDVCLTSLNLALSSLDEEPNDCDC